MIQAHHTLGPTINKTKTSDRNGKKFLSFGHPVIEE
jgi:hypothetical protein